jgi:hypothetical protein
MTERNEPVKQCMTYLLRGLISRAAKRKHLGFRADHAIVVFASCKYLASSRRSRIARQKLATAAQEVPFNPSESILEAWLASAHRRSPSSQSKIGISPELAWQLGLEAYSSGRVAKRFIACLSREGKATPCELE